MAHLQNINEVVEGAFLLDESISAKEYLNKPFVINEVFDAETSYGRYLIMKGVDGQSGESLLLRSGASAVVHMLSGLVGQKGIAIAMKLVKVGRAYRPAPLTDEEMKQVEEVINENPDTN